MRPIDLRPALKIPGFMSPAELTWLATQAQACQTIIEVGSFCGRSTRALADHCPGTVYAVDPWMDGAAKLFRVKAMRETAAQSDAETRGAVADHDCVYAAWTRNLQDHLASGRVQPIRASSLAAGAQLPATADLVFLDGDHREETVRAEIAAYRPLLRPGGILAGHDYGNKKYGGVKAAVDALVGPVNVVDYVWWAPCAS